ncbi:MAG: ECF transporter S component [Clostridia bacterium]|nr:ECF transporter S component [Clostridia bacterium]
MKNSKTNFIVKVGVFSAIAFVLQVIGSLMAIKVAGFLEVEISDLPAIIIALAMGPWAGVCVELVKNLLHCTMSSTGLVGELANFAVNGVFVFVCGMIYQYNKTKKGAVISLLVATVVMAGASILTNLFIMLPLYMPAVSFADKLSLTLSVIAPFNLVRGAALSVITMLIYKKISTLIKR